MTKHRKEAKKLNLRKHWSYLILLLIIIGLITTGKILADKKTKSLDNCNKEVKGLITEKDHRINRGDYFHYEFKIGNKKYKGTQDTIGLWEKMDVGDSVVIEYSCDNPDYHRIKE